MNRMNRHLRKQVENPARRIVTRWLPLWTIAVLLIAPLGMPLTPSRAGPANSDTASTSTQRRVTLTPVFRKKPEEQRLIPVFRNRPVPGQSILPGENDWRRPDERPPWKLPEGWPDAAGHEDAVLTSVRVARHRLAAAEALSQRGALEESRRSFLKLADDFPKSLEAPQSLLLAALNREDLNGARSELRGLIARYPWSEPCRTALAKIGEFSFFLGDYDETILAYEAYLKVAPSYEAASQIQLTLALVTLRAGQYSEAESKFELLASKYPSLVQMPEFMAGYAETLLALGEWNRSAELYQEIEGKFPNYEFTAQIMMGQGLAAELQGDLRAAYAAYRTIEEGFPESTEAAMARDRLNDLAIRLISP